jgi:diadenosine tetraphosphate (Ap4A) HIT family hydrolase
MTRIDRATARARIVEQSTHACLMCGILAAPDLPEQRLAERPACIAVYSRFPLVMGHVLIISRHHVEAVAEMPDADWLAMCQMGQAAARVLERRYRPARTYVASLGSAAGSAPNTCPHVHLHVIPVMDAATRPADLLTWDNGVIDSTSAVWRADVEGLRAEFERA